MEIDPNYFEHLLGCLANQKFISSFHREDKEEAQKIIDKAYHEGWELLLRPKVKPTVHELEMILNKETSPNLVGAMVTVLPDGSCQFIPPPKETERVLKKERPIDEVAILF